MSHGSLRSRLQHLERTYVAPSDPYVILVIHPDHDQPPTVLVFGVTSRDEEQAIVERELAAWRAERGNDEHIGSKAIRPTQDPRGRPVYEF